MNWLNYLLQVNLYLVLFYSFYRLLLRSETFFNLNRGYLVASAALAFFIPLMQSEWVRSWFVTEQISQTISILYDPQTLYIRASATPTHTMTVGEIIAFCYIIGIMLGIARFGGNLVFLGQMMKRKIQGEGSKRAFSFFNVLFVSKELKSRTTIMKHEFVHIRQLHSADVLLFELIAIFNWFNPVVYLYKSSIKHIHEFIADEVASRNEASKAEYAMLLFQEQFGVQAIPLTNNFFNQSLLKLRIKMLHKSRSTQTALMKYGLIAPLFMLMIVVSSATLASKQLNKIEEKVEKISEGSLEEVLVKPSKTAREVLSEANINLSDALIVSPALVDEVTKSTPFNKYLMRNLRYPSKAQKELITGMSYIGFTVNNSGKLLNIKTLKEKNSILSEEVKRVLQSIDNANTLDLSEPNDYVISVNFGLEVSKGNVTSELFSSESTINFEGRKKLDDIVVMGYAENISREIKRDTIFDRIDQQAEFPGGMEGFSKYLQENLKYPVAAQKANIKGKVYTEFIVNKDGSASDFKTLKGIGYGCDEEAIRVIKSVPKWNPGRHKDEIVISRFIVPINFQLSE
jgi:TonB family protein